MPIKPENRRRYPANWPEIRERIRARSGNRCEWCGVPNGAVGYRRADGEWVPMPRALLTRRSHSRASVINDLRRGAWRKTA